MHLLIVVLHSGQIVKLVVRQCVDRPPPLLLQTKFLSLWLFLLSQQRQVGRDTVLNPIADRRRACTLWDELGAERKCIIIKDFV